MTAVLIDGKAFAAKVRAQVAQHVAKPRLTLGTTDEAQPHVIGAGNREVAALEIDDGRAVPRQRRRIIRVVDRNRDGGDVRHLAVVGLVGEAVVRGLRAVMRVCKRAVRIQIERR